MHPNDAYHNQQPPLTKEQEQAILNVLAIIVAVGTITGVAALASKVLR